MKKILYILIAISISYGLKAQERLRFVYENRVYKKSIKTVECYNIKKEQSIPIINLNTDDQILFSFDDLSNANANYTYTIEHCTSDWKPSGISTLDYIDGFSTDRLMDYKLSFNTIQKYTHYEMRLPNSQIKPKLAGNYLLKVYDGSESKPVVSQRFYVSNNQAAVDLEIVPSSQVQERLKNQKINFTINHRFPVSNPTQDIKAVVMQNFNPHTLHLNTKPTFIRPGSLVYNDLTLNDFPAGNEYLKFDLRTLRSKGEGVQDIYRDSINYVVLYQDQPDNSLKYTNIYDENGKFFIRTQEGRDPRTEADYAAVNFSFKSPNTINGNLYIVGRFNNYELSAENKLQYFPDKKIYHQSIYLKQGLYDYKYVLQLPDGSIDNYAFEKSYFETENSYQVFVYYKKPGNRYEELVAFTDKNSTRK